MVECIVAALDAEEIQRHRDWLRSRWSVELDLEGAAEHEPYDPRRPFPDPAGLLGLLEERAPAEGLSSDQATLFVGRSLGKEAEFFRGRVAWEVGCGTGVLSALAARLGARRVLATDVVPRAVELARRTAERNGVSVEAAVADLFRGSPWREPVDILIADLPQKPAGGAALPLGQDGGPEGTRHLLPFLEEARARLRPDGRLYFFLHSLTHPAAFQKLHELFRPRVLATMWRIFEKESYGAILPYLVERRARDLCRFRDLPDGRHAFLSFTFSATPRSSGALRDSA